jgi:ATP-dependent protease Clp ATPase subunit
VTDLVIILAFSTKKPANFNLDLYTTENYYFLQVESSDLIAYGLIPEFVGRFPILVSLSALTENQLIQVGYICATIELGPMVTQFF